MILAKELGVRLGGSATLAASSQGKDALKREATLESAVWQATSRRARSGAPPVISGNVKDKPASYFVVKVAPPAGSPPGAASQACEAVRSMSVIGILQQKTTTEILSLAMKIVFRR